MECQCAGQIVFNYLAIDTGGQTINGLPVRPLLVVQTMSQCACHCHDVGNFCLHPAIDNRPAECCKV